jgi:hypothetical protein
MYKVTLNKTVATATQKEYFKTIFAEIIKDNPVIRDQYSIQFFDTPQKSNYAFIGRGGKSINVLSMLTLEEAERYKQLKSTWQN